MKKRRYLIAITILSVIVVVLFAILIFIFAPTIVTSITIHGKDSTIRTSMASTYLSDSTIIPPPNTQKLYVVGRTPKTSGGIGMSGTTTQKGFLIQENATILHGPAILLKIDSHTKAIYPHNKTNRYTNLVYLKGAKNIQLFFHVNPQYLSQYRYRILINDTVVLSWRQPSSSVLLNDLFPKLSDTTIYRQNSYNFVRRKKEIKQTESFLLADMNMRRKKMKLQLYNLSNPLGTSTVIIYNKPFPKPIIRIGGSLRGKDSLGGGAWMQSFRLNFDSATSQYYPDKPDIHINQIDRLFIGIGSSIATKFFKVTIKNTSSLFAKTFQLGTLNADPEANRVPIKDPKKIIRKPGVYKVTVTPQLPRYRLKFANLSNSVEFTVLPSSATTPEKTFTFKQVAIYIGILILIVLLFFRWYRSRQKRKLRESKRQSELAQAELNAVRLQLNPHFVFNALSGIQNLMNKKEIDTANRYLGKFARLTRNVLDDTYKDLISISEEVKLLDDYLQMEQLRFGFHYSIEVDKNLDIVNTEIPAMLFQPFVENAVKYGVYQKEAEGEVSISILKEGKDIFLKISDNGNGFDATKKYDGLGIKLSKSRINLLNTLYKNAEIYLDLNSGKEGTHVSIFLKNWE